MLLDTLIKQHNLSAKDTAFMMRDKLIAADSSMETWMHNFDVEQKGKTDDETITYMHAQKKQIMAIDSQLNSVIKESNGYLKTKNK
jgi:hypothetical protein